MSSDLVLAQKRTLARRDIVDMSGANSLFGTLGTGAFPTLSRMGFIPEDGNGNIIQLTGNGDTGTARWIGLDTPQMQFWAYAYCSPLASVIDRIAEADTNGRIQFVDESTRVPLKTVNKSPKLLRIKKLLKKPNSWQTWEEFDAEQIVLCKVFGYCPVFAIGSEFADRSYTKALINLNRLFVTPVAEENFSIFGVKPMIKEWNLNIMGTQYIIPSKDIILIKDGFITKFDSLGLPISKLNGLDFFVSNICAAMEANNVILKRKGPLGIFSYDPQKDMAGATPLEPDAKDALQEDLRRYGLTINQIQYVVSKMPVKFDSISFNLRDLMTKEIIRDAIDGICDRYNYPAELMSGKNATYENRNSSEKFVYQNNIIPFSLRRMTRYDEFFGLEETSITKNFNHLPVLQEDIVKAGEAELAESEALDIEWKSGMITFNEFRIGKERDPIPGMDIYYPEYIKKFPSMDTNKPKEVKNGKKPASKNTSAKK